MKVFFLVPIQQILHTRKKPKLFISPNRNYSKHRIEVIRFTESKLFKTPNRSYSFHRIKTIQNTESIKKKKRDYYYEEEKTLL